MKPHIPPSRPPIQRRTRRVARLLMLGLAVASLGNCSLSRLSELQGQACEFEEHVAVSLEPEFEIRFLDPVLLDRDIARVLDHPPAHEVVLADRLIHTYALEKADGSPAGTLPLQLELEYETAGGHARLAALRFPPEMARLQAASALTDPVVTQRFANEACEFGIGDLFGRSETPLDPVFLEHLPTRDEVLAWAGPPVAIGPEGQLEYTWRLRNGQSGGPQLAMGVQFDENGQRPLSMTMSYGKVNMETDFQRGVVRRDIGF